MFSWEPRIAIIEREVKYQCSLDDESNDIEQFRGDADVKIQVVRKWSMNIMKKAKLNATLSPQINPKDSNYHQVLDDSCCSIKSLNREAIVPS